MRRSCWPCLSPMPPKPDRHTQQTVGVRLDPGDKARLAAYAERTGQAVRQVIIKAIREYLCHHESPGGG